MRKFQHVKVKCGEKVDEEADRTAVEFLEAGIERPSQPLAHALDRLDRRRVVAERAAPHRALEEEEEQGRLEKQLRRLKKEIDKIEEKHWEADAELIKWRLTFDILEKEFGMKAAYAYDVAVDPQVGMAREIIADAERYESYFRRIEIGLTGEKAIAAAPDSSALEVRLEVDLGVLEDPVSEF